MKLSTLQKSFQLLERGDFQATYDLSSAYHHVKIHPDHRKYLGFAVPGPNGEEEFYQFECMPFGLASATKYLARLTKPICALLAREGIRHSLFIDDGKINAPRKLIGKHLERTLEVLDKSGFPTFSILLTHEGSHREAYWVLGFPCLLYTSPSPRDRQKSRMPSSA